MPRILTSTLLALAVAWPLAAQEPDSAPPKPAPVELEALEIVGSIAPTAGPAIGSGIPARISTVTGQAIDAWEPRLLPDALATQPGISLYDDLGSPAKLNLSTRGFSVGPVVGLPPGVSVFLDGVRQNEPDAAEVNFDLLPMEHVRRIELLSGAGSLLGSNSLGGAINLLTNRGKGPLQADLEVAGGSYGSRSAEGSLSGSGHGGFDYYLGGGYEREDGWRKATGSRNYNGFLNLGHTRGRRSVGLQLFGASSRARTAGSLPESIFRNDPAGNFTIGDFEDLDQIQLAGHAATLTSTGRLSGTLYYRRTNAERFNVNQAPDDNVRSFTRNRTVGATVDWRWNRSVGGDLFSLRLGADAAVNRVHVRLFTEEPVTGDDSLTTNVKSPSGDVAGYALGDYRTGRFTLSGGLRFDYLRLPFRNLLDPSGDTLNTFSRLSPRGGVNVDLGDGASAYLSVGQSFRAPAILELACADAAAACPLPFALGDDPPLDPVVGLTYEVGGRLVRGASILSASVYRTEVRDDIGFIQSDSAVFEGYFDNIGDTRREGIELSLQSQVSERVTLYANYAWTRATYRSRADIFSIRSDAAFAGSPLAGANRIAVGDRLPLVPAHQVKAGLHWQANRWLDLGGDARYTGRQWLRGDEANETNPLDAYFVAGLRAGLTFGPWELNTVLTNLFNTHRAVFGTFNENRQTGQLERFLTPVAARSLKVVVSRSFGGAD